MALKLINHNETEIGNHRAIASLSMSDRKIGADNGQIMNCHYFFVTYSTW